ncbi:bromodomain-containing factor 2-like [Sitophilus oryzae]|uniref:Bromodomain-containing factor 2-like n=1 Tax=Sitophilus oryzae TaxID=7048 RepID=A0A6J2YDC7_SITOR|nr:bromodomain-containing factor 2-like [Sitophilus oryzae]
MDLSDEDIIKIYRDLQNCSNNPQTRENLYKELKDYEAELDNCRYKDFNLHKELKLLYSNDNFDITAQYVCLQEKLQGLLNDTLLFEKEFNILKTSTNCEMQEFAAHYENDNKLQTELHEFKLDHIYEQMKDENDRHNIIVQKLQSELELLGASTALEEDDIETEMRKELVDLNMRIRQMHQINSNIQRDIDEIKNKKQREYYNTDDVNELQNIKEEIIINLEPENNKENCSDLVTVQMSTSLKKSSVEKKKKNKNLKKLEIIQAPIIKETNSKKKRRKLYDPDDLTYLDKIELRD